MMKKLIAFLLMILMIALPACGETKAPVSTAKETPRPVQTEVPETEAPVAREESDVRTVAQDTEGADAAAAGSRGQDLTGILMGVFLALLMIEFILAREPWSRRKGKGAAA